MFQQGREDTKTFHKLFYFEHPHPLLVEILWGWALQGDSGLHSGGWALRGLGTPGRLGVESGACTLGNLGLGYSGRLWGWALPLGAWGGALPGDSGAAHSGDTLGLGTLRGDSGVGHSRETLELGSKNTLKLGTPGHFGVGHRDERGVDWARRRVPGEEKSSGR